MGGWEGRGQSEVTREGKEEIVGGGNRNIRCGSFLCICHHAYSSDLQFKVLWCTLLKMLQKVVLLFTTGTWQNLAVTHCGDLCTDYQFASKPDSRCFYYSLMTQMAWILKHLPYDVPAQFLRVAHKVLLNFILQEVGIFICIPDLCNGFPLEITAAPGSATLPKDSFLISWISCSDAQLFYLFNWCPNWFYNFMCWMCMAHLFGVFLLHFQ